MYSNILVPVAFDDGSEDKIRQATAIARTLAAPDARLTFLHVMEQIPSYAITYIPADYLAQSRVAVRKALEELAAEETNAQGVLVDGHSGRTILDWAGDNGVDLIVIASHRPAMQDYFLGSTANLVVRHAPCAVHVLR